VLAYSYHLLSLIISVCVWMRACISDWERKFHDFFAPGSESSTSFSFPRMKVSRHRSRERKLLRAKVPVTYRRCLLLHFKIRNWLNSFHQLRLVGAWSSYSGWRCAPLVALWLELELKKLYPAVTAVSGFGSVLATSDDTTCSSTHHGILRESFL